MVVAKALRDMPISSYMVSTKTMTSKPANSNQDKVDETRHQLVNLTIECIMEAHALRDSSMSSLWLRVARSSKDFFRVTRAVLKCWSRDLGQRIWVSPDPVLKSYRSDSLLVQFER